MLPEEDTPISEQKRDEILRLNEDMKMGDRARRQTEERRVGAAIVFCFGRFLVAIAS